VASQLKQQYAKENVNTGATVVPVRDDLSQPSALTLIALAGAAACVLLIACANLANLLLARALARRRELAVRQALGAGRERLVRQLLTESLILAGTGGVLGVLFAALTMPLLSQLVPDSLPIAATPGLDLRVLMFAAAATTVTGLVFGMVPALYGRASAGSDGLRDGARAGERGRERLRGILVVVEIALSVVLLVSGGLLLRALERIQRIDPGFATEHILTARTSLPMPKFENRAPREQFYTRVLSNLRALPGVSSAAYISFLPMGDNRGGIWPVGLHGPEAERRENQVATLRYVTPGFFSTLSIPILRGRDVDDADTASRPYVAVVSQSFAMRFWPDQDPIGRHFFFAFSDRTVVGVVGDIHVRGLTRQSEPQVYVPFNQVADSALTWYAPKDLAIRTTGDPLSIASSLRRIVHEADPRQPLSEVRPLTDVVGEDTAPRAMQLRIIGGFALMAVLLAAVGIHGLLSFAVSQRTHEIGVRRALGASSVDIVTMVVRRSTWLAAVGILAGVAIAYYAGRTMESLLAGVKPADTLTLASAVTLAAVMTLAGSALPTLRAVRVNPTEALRAE
jgi:putative ABC transport system permease protein